MFYLSRGGGVLSLSHASESPSEISTEQNQEGFFSKTAGIISYLAHQEVYTEWQYGVATWYFVYFCDDGIHARKGLFADERTFMDYDTLDDYPGEFYNMLWELHEA